MYKEKCLNNNNNSKPFEPTNTVCLLFETHRNWQIPLIRKLARRHQEKRPKPTSNLGPEMTRKVSYWLHQHRAKTWVWLLPDVNTLQILACSVAWLWPYHLALPRLVQGIACAKDYSHCTLWRRSFYKEEKRSFCCTRSKPCHSTSPVPWASNNMHRQL